MFIRKEAESFKFTKMNQAKTFRDAWNDNRREVMNKSGATKAAVSQWWVQLPISAIDRYPANTTWIS